MSALCFIDAVAIGEKLCQTLLVLPECERLENADATIHARLLRLRRERDCWQFILPGDNARVSLDYNQTSIARRLTRNNLPAEHVVRAVRGRRGPGWHEPIQVFDATAGLGIDSLLLAASGCDVLLAERLPLLAQLLEQSLCESTTSSSGVVAMAARRCHVLATGSLEQMLDWQGDAPAVVYLDPMYATSAGAGGRGLKASAAVNKNMRLLQLLSEIYLANYSPRGEAAGDDELLEAARQLATTRVVVKRAPAAPPLAGSKPTSCLAGKAARFDVYAC